MELEASPLSAKKALEWPKKLSDFLKTEGLRSTKQRELVAEVALQFKTHFEIQALVKATQEKYPDIGPATVYRSVKTLCEAGILSETLQSDSGITLYEASEDGHHDHIVCLDCGEIFEFHSEALERAQEKATSELGFTQTKHQHVIYAKCDQYRLKK